MSLPTPLKKLGARRRALTQILLTVAALVGGLLAPQPAAAQAGSVNGFVIDTLGNRVSGATVAAVSGPSAPRQTTTAADGSFLLSRLNAGNYVFTANRTGYTGTSRSFTVNSGVNARIDFTIRSQTAQGGVVQGHVFQRGSTTPIAGARVDLTGGAGVPSQSTTTDESGLYTFSSLATARIRLTVTRAGYYNESRSLSVTQGRTITADFNLRLRASQLASLSGVITDTAGAVIRGAVVTLGGGNSSGMTDTTDSRGRYSFTRVIPDTYTVSVSAAGYVSNTATTVFLDADESEVLNVSLTALGASTGGVTGLVVDSNGQPLTGARVVVTGGPVTGKSDTTDATGLYEILSLPAGTYTLRASATGFNPLSRTIAVTTDTSSRLDFALTEQTSQLRGSITGQVTQTDGTAISNVIVRVTAGPTQGQSVLSDDQGDYGIPELPEGTYTLTFTRSGYASRTLTGVEVNAGLATTLDVELALSNTGSSLSGTVTDEDGNAVASVQVRVLQNNTVVATATTNSTGTYQISGLSAGTYVVQFSKTGFTTAQVSGVEITAGSSATVDVQLTGSGNGLGILSGTVLDNLGRPIQGAVVELSGASGNLATTTDADGVFQFANLTPATNYTLSVSASGFVTDTRRNVAVTANDETNVRIQLVQDSSSGGSLSGFVRAPNGAAVVGASVRIVAGPAVGQSRTTSSTGQFSFAGLPGGAYSIEVRSVNFRPARVTVNVRGGAGAFVTITLRR